MKWMKFAAALFAVCIVCTFANVGFAASLANTKYDTGTTSADVVFPFWDNKIEVVTAYSATSDKSGAVLEFFERGTASAQITSTSAADQKIMKLSTTSAFDATTPGAGDYVAIVKASTKAVQWNRISSKTDNVSLNMNNNLSAATGSGDMVYSLSKIASVPVGNATVSNSSTGALGLIVGKAPVLAILDGTSACSINFLTTVAQ